MNKKELESARVVFEIISFLKSAITGNVKYHFSKKDDVIKAKTIRFTTISKAGSFYASGRTSFQAVVRSFESLEGNESLKSLFSSWANELLERSMNDDVNCMGVYSQFFRCFAEKERRKFCAAKNADLDALIMRLDLARANLFMYVHGVADKDSFVAPYALRCALDRIEDNCPQ